jgi:hypothetical protein
MIKILKQYLSLVKKLIPKHKHSWTHLGYTGYSNGVYFMITGKTKYCRKCKEYREENNSNN